MINEKNSWSLIQNRIEAAIHLNKSPATPQPWARSLNFWDADVYPTEVYTSAFLTDCALSGWQSSSFLFPSQPCLSLHSQPGTVWHRSSVQPVIEFTRVLSLTKTNAAFWAYNCPFSLFSEKPPSIHIASSSASDVLNPIFLLPCWHSSCFTVVSPTRLPVTSYRIHFSFFPFDFIKLITTFLWMSDAV